MDKETRFMRFMAAINGVDLEEPSKVSSNKGQDDWMKPLNERYNITDGSELVGFEYGLGYETVPNGE